MPEQEALSLMQLILAAGPLVKCVMLLLLAASVSSWYMIANSALYQRHAKRELRRFENLFWSDTDMTSVYRDGNNRAKHQQTTGAENIFRAGFKEFSRLRQQAGSTNEVVMTGMQRVMKAAMAREEERLETNLPFLASVASVSPYVGLFGTVWGIMSSFQSLANQPQASLAAVAPGISEALIATAMGLFAAIPAVLAYNRFSATAEKLHLNYEAFADEFYSILHRQIHASA